MLPIFLLTLALVCVASPVPKVSIGNEELCDKYSNFESQDGLFVMNNNMWGKDLATSGQQCLRFVGADQNRIIWSTSWNWEGAETKVKSFPYGGRKFIPKKINKIKSLPTSIKWSYDSENVWANVAYDLFSSANPNHDNGSGEFEMMIWLAKFGEIQPIADSHKPVDYTRIAGHTWALYEGSNDGMKVWSFVAQDGPIREFHADAMEFWNFLKKKRGFPARQQYLLTFQAGTEPFKGGSTFRAHHFDAAVN